MENKGVLVGSIIFVFASFFLMIGLLAYESYKAKQMKQLAASVKSEVRPAASSLPVQDFSMYKTRIGDEGREMVQVPEGPFTMGSNDGDPDEAPEHQVYLKGFYIDRNEVTQQEYQRFAKMTKRGMPRIEVFDDDQSKILKPELAAMSVSWDEAAAYCKWAGKRLPTEAEWEKAGRGESRRRYPWGDKFVVNAANVDGAEDGYKYLAPPGSFEVGRSPYGIHDMTGNVAEWVEDSYDESYYKKSPFRDPKGPENADLKVVRGGSWRETEHHARLSKRFAAKHWRTDVTIGIRCASDLDPASAEN
ncbi:MAG: formylglycine-generating enzyme family protein [Nitrospira sp.]|nr:formylglycine-generating enzyme family protein [Nitrospira sp.]MDH4302981.1 formylglycine-generating enzyme family protein [Nitrospira sp.]MDH5193220.1 formylglycine-generating enzyme family protein [Nitrospira sp.]